MRHIGAVKSQLSYSSCPAKTVAPAALACCTYTGNATKAASGWWRPWACLSRCLSPLVYDICMGLDAPCKGVLITPTTNDLIPAGAVDISMSPKTHNEHIAPITVIGMCHSAKATGCHSDRASDWGAAIPKEATGRVDGGVDRRQHGQVLHRQAQHVRAVARGSVREQRSARDVGGGVPAAAAGGGRTCCSGARSALGGQGRRADDREGPATEGWHER